MAINLEYFRKINDTYQSQSKQETDLYILNRHVNRRFDDTIDYQKVLKNGEPFELLIIKDTDGNTHKKKIKSKHGDIFNLGDYIEWDGQIWLVALVDTDTKTYHSGYMFLCTMLLRWQNSTGDIIERWCYAEDFTKYSAGVESNNTFTVGDNQYGITMPVDSETIYLKRDKRFVIDFDGVFPPDVYRLTNRKLFLKDNRYFSRGGVVVFTFSYDFFNKDTDKLVKVDDKEFYICNLNQFTNIKVTENDEVDDGGLEYIPVISNVIGKIKGTSNLINLNRRKSISCYFTDLDNNPTEFNGYAWQVMSNINEHIAIEYDTDKILLTLKNEDCIDETITVNLTDEDNTIVYDTIKLLVTD